MPFPSVIASTDGNAQAAFQSACNAAGLQLNTLNAISQLQLALANLLDYDPTTSDVPAGNIVPGTFAANTASPTGSFTFPGTVTGGAASFTTGAFSGNLTVGAFVVTAATAAVSASGTGMHSFTQTVDGSPFTITNSYSGFTGVNLVLAATRASSAGYYFLYATANGVPQFTLKGDGSIVTTGALAITGALTGVTTSAFSGDMNIGSGKFTVAAATGNTVVAGNVSIAGTSASVAASTISLGGITRTTIGANGGASALTVLPLGYLDIYVAGVAAQIPYYTRGA